MPTFVKLLAALLLPIFIFTGFIFLPDIKLLDFVETHFYNPSVVNSYVKENSTDAELVQNYIIDLQNKFEAAMTEPAVRSSFLYNQSLDNIFERSKILGILMESTGGLQSVQFVDSNGIRLHYSNSSRDIMSQNQNSTAYRNYNENPQAIPYEIVSVQDGDNTKLTMDEQNDRIIFSFPFKDSMDVYHGTALFTVSVSTLAERLIAQGRLKVGDYISVIKEPSGILLGSSETSKTAIHYRVSEIWSEGIQSYVTLDAEDSGMAFSLITAKTNQNIFFGRLVSTDLFSISEPMKLILKVSIFLTIFLVFFLLLNLKPTPVTIIKNRLRRLRESLFEQLEVDKSIQERVRWILELEQRRDEIKLQLKRNIRLKSHSEANINNIIDKSWDEMLAFLRIGSGQEFTVVQQVKKEKTEEIKETVEEKIEEVEAIEEIGEVEAIEEIETIDEIEETGEVEAIEEVETIDEIEEIGEVEEISEVESIEEVEVIDEFEEIGEIEEIDDVEEVEIIDDLSEIEELGEVEETIEFREIDENKETNIIDIALRAAMETDDHRHGGLFWLASKFIGSRTAFSASRGLLSLASKKILNKPASVSEGLLRLAIKKALKKPVSAGKGLLAHASEYEKPAPVLQGLLSLANKIALKKPAPAGKGLLAHASELENKTNINENQDLIADIDVVSPFSDMFSSLKG